jgi:undecaprenyl-diphosphatase
MTEVGANRSAPMSRWRRFVAARLDSKAYLGLHFTVGLVVATLGLWLFGALLDAVLDDATMVRLDVAADAWVHARTTAAGLRVFDVVTQLGSPAAMGALAVGGALVLWRQRRHDALVAWLAAFLGGAALGKVLKTIVHRTRPAFGVAYLHGHSYSFPSGHAMGSIIGYSMLLYLLRLYWHPRRERRRLLVGAVALLVFLVGLSRVYLGVHYPSDVVGGWAAGAAWLAVCLTGVSVVHSREAIRGKR